MSTQTTEQLAMLIEDLSSELDKAHSDIAELRKLLARVADNQLRSADVLHKVTERVEKNTTDLERAQRLIKPKAIRPKAEEKQDD